MNLIRLYEGLSKALDCAMKKGTARQRHVTRVVSIAMSRNTENHKFSQQTAINVQPSVCTSTASAQYHKPIFPIRALMAWQSLHSSFHSRISPNNSTVVLEHTHSTFSALDYKTCWRSNFAIRQSAQHC